MDVKHFERIPDDENDEQETGQVTAKKDTSDAHTDGRGSD